VRRSWGNRLWEWFAFPVFAVVLLFSVAACTAEGRRGVADQVTGVSEYDEVRMKLQDGRTVLCLDGANGAFSCDWAGAK
jgi:hypothetical protein